MSSRVLNYLDHIIMRHVYCINRVVSRWFLAYPQNSPYYLQTSPYLLFINLHFPRTNHIPYIPLWIHLHPHTLKLFPCTIRKLLQRPPQTHILLPLTPLQHRMQQGLVLSLHTLARLLTGGGLLVVLTLGHGQRHRRWRRFHCRHRR